jgi:hypothetical protein
LWRDFGHHRNRGIPDPFGLGDAFPAAYFPHENPASLTFSFVFVITSEARDPGSR